MMILECKDIDLSEEEILAELERIRVSNGYDLTVLLFTNPLSSSHERVLLSGETRIVEKAFNVQVEGAPASCHESCQGKRISFQPSARRSVWEEPDGGKIPLL